ncbi:Gfo/Idh/MocA family oxidoreductase [Chryseolinea sp. T2]|uniref:Gfo/Idh/MocA family protein n=1 Tax=Chryseolinea sp. T2 TaxID=3129255 RepID=UPI003078226F
MKTNRRDFIKISTIAGMTMAGEATIASPKGTKHTPQGQAFNMSGYAAPKIETVRIGFIGLGNRGPGAVERISKIDGVEIKALCDIRPEKAEAARKLLEKTPHKPDLYSGGAEEWKKVCDRKDIDLIYIATPWKLHAPMAVFAMEHGKHAAVEVPAAVTIDECWQMVNTSEKTKKHCVILENCCYDFFELLTLNMARQGYFGEIVHVEGAYIHALLDANFSKTQYYDMWRLKENLRNGSLYPTHGLGPIAQALNVNRGDRMDYLVSVSTNDFMMGAKAKELAATDSFYKQYEGKSFRGNMNTTTIRTVNGKTMMVQHDVTSPRPYSRIHLVSGTKGTALKYPEPPRISKGHEGWVTDEEFKELEAKYAPPIVTKVGEMAKQIGGHGGMDFLMDWRLIDCLRNGLPVDMDVYDAAAWSAVAPLSEKSVANRSASVDVPDFTRGAWKSNAPVDVQLLKGGTTRVRL